MKFFLVHIEARLRAMKAVEEAPYGWQVTVSEPKRNLEQNAAQWPVLEAFSRQLQWAVNGHLTTLAPEEWKDILTAAFEGDARVAPGLNGGHVFLGQRTREYSKQRFSEWLEFLNATAVERGVNV